MTSNTHAYNWLKQISPNVMKWDKVPLFGASPDFPWEELAKKLAQLFQIQSLRITHQETDWRNPEDFSSGLGGEPLYLQIGLSNVEGTLVFAMSRSDTLAIMGTLLGGKPEEFTALDKDLIQGFHHYLAAQILFTLAQLPFGKNLGLSVLDSAKLPTEPSLCLEIAVVLGENQMKSRFIISPEALDSWKQRFADRSLSTALHSPLAEKLEIPIHLEIGRTSVLPSEWSKVSPGDFVILDHCSYDLEAGKGRVMLTIDGKPMFRAKLKQGNIKILEFPLTYEAPMNNEENSSHEDDLGEFDEGLGEETEEVGAEEEGAEEEHEELEEAEAPEEGVEEEAPKAPPTPPVKEKKFDPLELPLNIVIEVGRLQMSVKQLLELEPGNTLELDVHPENGVDLVVNGRRIGKAELLRIGDNLGVRILDIG